MIRRAPVHPHLHLHRNWIGAQHKMREPMLDDWEVLQAGRIEPPISDRLNHIGADFEFGQRPKPAPNTALRTTLKPD